ncbi:hypothetical protein E2C01_056485 [Portunus trituberculatus]|uniref:Uncharacterized protein n=1 Tax=Portunus trituberculatus TaxID=210409 RepID=A0A5B7GQR5_PORTR|nr:hypothetical protein [Portunus trituberculatus]
MAPKRLTSGENKEASESVSVSEPQPSTSGFKGTTPNVLMDGDSSSDNLPPPPHRSPLDPLLYYPSAAFTMSASVSEPQPSATGFTGITPDVFMEGPMHPRLACCPCSGLSKPHLIRNIGDGFTHFLNYMKERDDVACVEYEEEAAHY